MTPQQKTAILLRDLSQEIETHGESSSLDYSVWWGTECLATGTIEECWGVYERQPGAELQVDMQGLVIAKNDPAGTAARWM